MKGSGSGLLAPSNQGTGLREYSRLTYRQYSFSQSEARISISIWASKYTLSYFSCKEDGD